ncbi:phosphate uptake regulator, PhoU [Methanococcus vannielii SB]|uniref:Phosphate-specific transport system accessory protein PhoU n=1 Tax=Methanococcus vannielii (strain ATCC 35089 / DSM 1224 / JCM 13029 / OCM 148 / SB) TaxID=406327 RepID=A6UPB0_METVS|nr:phosphate signaling complex protein PhoU [Methanococcus vannielii]ABR54332.1 phosphate uptake regulator, PhoU [Methanococcus vannielii SB]
MVRNEFSKQMELVENLVLEMSKMCKKSLEDAILAFTTSDKNLAEIVKNGDDEIDLKEMEIEEKCISLMARQQPVAGDLREILTVIKIISKLEKIGDMASRIAKTTINSENNYLRSKNSSTIILMGEMLQKMLEDSTCSFKSRDLKLAKEVYFSDKKIDELYKTLYREMTCHMIENPKTIGESSDFLIVGTYLERVGNICASIGDRTAYMVTGERIKEEEFEGKIDKKS